MEPALPSTPLISGRQPLLTHPRMAGGIWCALWAGLTFALPVILFSGWKGLLVLPVGLLALLPGIKYGSAILDRQKTTRAWDAVHHGLVVVLATHIFVFLLIAAFCILAALLTFKLEMIAVGLGYLVIGTAFSVLAPGCVTLPAGALGAWLLFKFRDYGTRPSGCRLHGYRAPEISASP